MTVISQIPTLRDSYLADQVLGDLSLSNGNVTDSYSEGSYLGDQVLTYIHLPPSVSNDNFTDSYSESSYLADQVLADLPPLSPQGFHRFLLWEFIFGRPGLGMIFHPSPNSDFTQIPNSESSYLAGQVLADLPPPLSAHFTDSYSESSYLDNQVLVDPPFSLCLKWQFHRFLLWGLIFGRPWS